MRSLGWGRRVAVVVVTTAVVAGVGILSGAELARANVCQKDDVLGNATVAAGPVAAGVSQNDIGTFQHDVRACADAAGTTVYGTVDVTDRNTSAPGIQVSPEVCTYWWWNCGYPNFFTTGVEVVPPATVTVPAPSVNPPADGNGSVGADAGTGNTVCAWVAGAQSCGGATTAGGDPPPVNPQPDPVGLAVYMVGMALSAPNYVDFCLDVIPPNITHGAVGCALVVATQYVLSPALMVVDWFL